MTPLVQTIIVGALIAICAFFAIRRGLRSLTGKKTGCGCAECPALKPKPVASQPPQTPSTGPVARG